MTVEAIAKIAHETNRAYCATLGDASQPAWEEAPQWQKDSAIDGVKSHLAALVAGARLTPDASHEKWLEYKRHDGWQYGPVRDPAKKEHPCFVPYSQLPVEQRLKDYLFFTIVDACHTCAAIEAGWALQPRF